MKKLDISKNPSLTIKSYKALFKHFVDTRAKITHLNFEGNEIGDDTVKELGEMMMYLRGIQFLNLSKCGITDVGAISLAEVIDTPGLSLRTLLIHWNQIRNKGSIVLAKAVKKNTVLQIFDASFNAFGSGPL